MILFFSPKEGRKKWEEERRSADGGGLRGPGGLVLHAARAPEPSEVHEEALDAADEPHADDLTIWFEQGNQKFQKVENSF